MSSLSMEDEYRMYVKRALSRYMYTHYWSRIHPGYVLLYGCGAIVVGLLLGSFLPSLAYQGRSFYCPTWLPKALQIVCIGSPVFTLLLFEGLSYRQCRRQAKDPLVMFSVIQTLTNEDMKAGAYIGGIASTIINGLCKVHVVSSNVEMMEFVRRERLSYIHSRLFPQTS